MNENIKCGYAFSYLDYEEYFGTKIIWLCLNNCLASFATPLSVHVLPIYVTSSRSYDIIFQSDDVELF